MTKKVKDKWVGARVDEDLDSLVDVYVDATDITMGDLVRRAVKEYMINHPIEVNRPIKAQE